MKTPWASIASIRVGGKHSGTGFLVTSTHVLTALHVVKNALAKRPKRIRLRFNPNAEFEDGSAPFETEAKLISECWDNAEDFAILECVDQLPEKLKPLRMSAGYRQGDVCYASGFAAANPAGFTAEGRVASINEPHASGATVIGLQFSFGSGLPVGGHSGAAVLVNGCVAGILREALLDQDGRSAGGLLSATRIQQVALMCGGLFRLSSAAAGPIQWPKGASEHAPVLADRKPEFGIFERMVTGQESARVLLLEGGSASGKSTLCAELSQYARCLGLAVAEVDLKSCPDSNDIFELMSSQIGEVLRLDPLAAGPSRLVRMIENCKALDRPLLIAFDTWEKSADETRNWLEKALLPQLGRMPGVVVMVAGQSVPEPEKHPAWRSLAVYRSVGPILSVDDWVDYSSRKWPSSQFSRDHVEALTVAGQGIPGVISRHLTMLWASRQAARTAAAGAGGAARG